MTIKKLIKLNVEDSSAERVEALRKICGKGVDMDPEQGRNCGAWCGYYCGSKSKNSGDMFTGNYTYR